MPPIFKALASVTAWILFIFGCIALLATIIAGAITGELLGPEAPPIQFYLSQGAAIVSLALSVVCMKLRQTLT